MFLLDTNVISELRKAPTGQAHPLVVAWATSVPVAKLFVSAITIMELELGVAFAERRDLRQGEVLRAWLDNDVMEAFAGRILPVDTVVAQRSASLQVPDRSSLADALISGTALCHHMIVVTRNEKDFEPLDVAVLNPWEERGQRSGD